MLLFQKENDVVATIATGTAAVLPADGAVGCRIFRGRGRPSHHRRRPTGQRLARKKRGILVPPKNARRRRTGRCTYDTAAADQYRYQHRCRRMCAASEQRQIIITIIAAAVVRTIAAARAHLVAGRYPSCSVVHRRQTRARAYTTAPRFGPERKGLLDRRTLFSRWTSRNSSGCRVNRNCSPSTLLRVHRRCRRRELTNILPTDYFFLLFGNRS